MKTIKEYLEELPGRVAKEALQNADPENLILRVHDAPDALRSAFDWGRSYKGYDFWQAIYDMLLANHRLSKKLEQAEAQLGAAELKIEELEEQAKEAEEAEELGDALHGEQIGILNIQALSKKLFFEKIAARWGDLTLLDMDRIEKILDEKGTYM